MNGGGQFNYLRRHKVDLQSQFLPQIDLNFRNKKPQFNRIFQNVVESAFFRIGYFPKSGEEPHFMHDSINTWIAMWDFCGIYVDEFSIDCFPATLL